MSFTQFTSAFAAPSPLGLTRPLVVWMARAMAVLFGLAFLLALLLSALPWCFVIIILGFHMAFRAHSLALDERLCIYNVIGLRYQVIQIELYAHIRRTAF